MTLNKLASLIAKREGKKSQARIGDIREVLKIIAQLEAEDIEAQVNPPPPPREPKRWRWPRLYASFRKDTGKLYGMRIVYPNGRGDHAKGWDIFYAWDSCRMIDYACWVSVIQHEKTLGYTPIDAPPNPRAANASRKAMFDYVRRTEGVEPVYLGEIK